MQALSSRTARIAAQPRRYALIVAMTTAAVLPPVAAAQPIDTTRAAPVSPSGAIEHHGRTLPSPSQDLRAPDQIAPAPPAVASSGGDGLDAGWIVALGGAGVLAAAGIGAAGRRTHVRAIRRRSLA